MLTFLRLEYIKLILLSFVSELQLQYTNFKNTLQQLAQKIGDIEQEAEEHKWVLKQPSHRAPGNQPAFVNAMRI